MNPHRPYQPRRPTARLTPSLAPESIRHAWAGITGATNEAAAERVWGVSEPSVPTVQTPYDSNTLQAVTSGTDYWNFFMSCAIKTQVEELENMLKKNYGATQSPNAIQPAQRGGGQASSSQVINLISPPVASAAVSEPPPLQLTPPVGSQESGTTSEERSERQLERVDAITTDKPAVQTSASATTSIPARDAESGLPGVEPKQPRAALRADVHDVVGNVERLGGKGIDVGVEKGTVPKNMIDNVTSAVAVDAKPLKKRELQALDQRRNDGGSKNVEPSRRKDREAPARSIVTKETEIRQGTATKSTVASGPQSPSNAKIGPSGPKQSGADKSEIGKSPTGHTRENVAKAGPLGPKEAGTAVKSNNGKSPIGSKLTGTATGRVAKKSPSGSRTAAPPVFEMPKNRREIHEYDTRPSTSGPSTSGVPSVRQSAVTSPKSPNRSGPFRGPSEPRLPSKGSPRSPRPALRSMPDLRKMPSPRLKRRTSIPLSQPVPVGNVDALLAAKNAQFDQMEGSRMAELRGSGSNYAPRALERGGRDNELPLPKQKRRRRK